MKKHIPVLEQRTQQHIGRGLRAVYEQATNLTPKMLELLEQLRELELTLQEKPATQEEK